MPPRFAYWTIIFGNQPTSFRSATKDDLLPTFKQIQAKHPDAVMMWFARGRLWRSEEEARDAFLKRREQLRGPKPAWRNRPPRSPDRRDPSRAPRVPPKPRNGEGARGRDWRPGGAHKDPRDRFKVPRDVKRARFKARLRRDRMGPKPPKKKDEE